ncbi:hypothetical protein [Streptomyces sp. CC208A]|uniref:hypothetical protein n=1 Tax=Streptomyces sp. CC208A TaxID=3044573 RepID=UPI0024A87CA8|nr:hypothetical protein [Streptomyces sp. CC208A]
MYLVHLRLRAPAGAPELPEGLEDALRAAEPAVELVIRHERPDAAPVLGFYLRAPDLDTAERLAATAWYLAVRDRPAVHAWTLLKAEVPLLLIDEPA